MLSFGFLGHWEPQMAVEKRRGLIDGLQSSQLVAGKEEGRSERDNAESR